MIFLLVPAAFIRIITVMASVDFSSRRIQPTAAEISEENCVFPKQNLSIKIILRTLINLVL